MNVLAYILLVSSSESNAVRGFCVPLTRCEGHTFRILHDLYRKFRPSVFIPEDCKSDVLFSGFSAMCVIHNNRHSLDSAGLGQSLRDTLTRDIPRPWPR
jgi:hypothetical protein